MDESNAYFVICNFKLTSLFSQAIYDDSEYDDNEEVEEEKEEVVKKKRGRKRKKMDGEIEEEPGPSTRMRRSVHVGGISSKLKKKMQKLMKIITKYTDEYVIFQFNSYRLNFSFFTVMEGY